MGKSFNRYTYACKHSDDLLKSRVKKIFFLQYIEINSCQLLIKLQDDLLKTLLPKKIEDSFIGEIRFF